MLYGIILGILIGMVWLPSIQLCIDLCSTKTWKELVEFIEYLQDNFEDICPKNKLMIIILIIIRLPLLIISIPIYLIHVYKLYKKESK